MDTSTTNKRRRKVTKLTMGKKHRKHHILASTNTESNSRFKEISTQVSPKKLPAMQSNFACDTEGLIAFSDVSIQKENVCDQQIQDLPKSFQEMIQNGTLNILCNILSQYQQLQDFENLLRNISCGKIDPNNICWLLNIHLGRLTSISSTT